MGNVRRTVRCFVNFGPRKYLYMSCISSTIDRCSWHTVYITLTLRLAGAWERCHKYFMMMTLCWDTVSGFQSSCWIFHFFFLAAAMSLEPFPEPRRTEEDSGSLKIKCSFGPPSKIDRWKSILVGRVLSVSRAPVAMLHSIAWHWNIDCCHISDGDRLSLVTHAPIRKGFGAVLWTWWVVLKLGQWIFTNTRSITHGDFFFSRISIHPSV